MRLFQVLSLMWVLLFSLPALAAPSELSSTTLASVSQRLALAQEQQQQLQKEQAALTQQLAHSQHLITQLHEQAEALQGSLLLAQLLYEQQQQLVAPEPLLFTDHQVSDWHIEQFELQQYFSNNLSSEAQHTLQELEALLEGNSLLATENRSLHQEVSALFKEGQALISERLFWMPSSRPLNKHWWQQLPSRLQQEIAQTPFHSFAREATLGIKQHWPWLGLAAVVSVLLRLYRRKLKAQLHAIQEQVGFVHYDHPLHTVEAIVLTAIVAAPLPLFLLSTALIWVPQPKHPVLFALHWQYAVALWLVRWAQVILQDESIAKHHFQWDANLCQWVKKRLSTVALLLIPVIWCIQIGLEHPASLLNDPLPPVLFILCCLVLAFLLWRPVPQQQGKTPLSQLAVSSLLIAAPLGMALATALGYHYSAITLMQRLLVSVVVVWLACLSYQMALRALSVLARELAHHRAVLRQELNQQKEDVLDAHDSAHHEDALNVDLFRLNEQALQLVRWATALATAVVLYYLWRDILGTLSYLNRIVLWEDAQEHITTLGHLLSALLILAVSIVLARNLPALISVTVLSRIALKPGSSYTITALLTYVLTATGIVWALAVVGVSWDKLQWLVAALGFGLGFGLQEIFANFVSGIILLFERPIRVGDYVTIGSYTGTVTRIRIRATTIRDNDKREVILPNKAFVTDRFTNWTLTDTTTRISITVGFDYNEDLNATRQLLLDVANANARVLKDPAPAALLTDFGDSNLEHTLRVHVKALSDRMRAIDEINRGIMELARERNITISYNQVEVTLKNKAGEKFALEAP